MNKIALTIISATFGLLFTTPSHASIILNITPSNQSVNVGSSISFAVDISGFDANTALSAYELDIGFDSALLSFSQAAFGDPLLGDQLDLLGLGLNTPLATASTNNVNLIEFSFDDTDTLNNQQAHGFTLATLSFNTLALGDSPITLTVNSLTNAEGNIIFEYSTQNGSVSVVSSVPLPSSFLLFLFGMSGLLPLARRG